jgi:hypothetical protein
MFTDVKRSNAHRTSNRMRKNAPKRQVFDFRHDQVPPELILGDGDHSSNPNVEYGGDERGKLAQQITKHSTERRVYEHCDCCGQYGLGPNPCPRLGA